MNCIKPTAEDIHISISRQRLMTQGGRSYPISSSSYGVGSKEGSYKSPIGMFQICEKWGSGAPLNTIYKSRIPAGVWDHQDYRDKDLILSRILRLSGLDRQNTNTYSRYIYIHGTNHEELIGSPASIGCIRMKNSDIIALYNTIDLGTLVHIEQ